MSEDHSRYYDELSRLNNEIVNMQRELAKKHEQLRQANILLDQRVQERTHEMRQAKEEAGQANAAKSEFLSRMSHELRTPMNSSLGFGQLMEVDSLNEKQAVRLAHILRSGYQLLKLIDEVLDMAEKERAVRLPPSRGGVSGP